MLVLRSVSDLTVLAGFPHDPDVTCRLDETETVYSQVDNKNMCLFP